MIEMFSAGLLLGVNFLSGNTLNTICGLNGSPLQCESYVVGAIDAWNFSDRLRPGRPLICVRAGVTAEQVADVVRKHLRDNPQSRDIDGSVIVMIAVGVAFPCPK